MKMTIEIHAVSECFADDLKRDIENACAYYVGGDGEMSPDPFITITEEDNPEFKVERCCMCHCERYAGDLDENGMCEDCAEEAAEEEEG